MCGYMWVCMYGVIHACVLSSSDEYYVYEQGCHRICEKITGEIGERCRSAQEIEPFAEGIKSRNQTRCEHLMGFLPLGSMS